MTNEPNGYERQYTESGFKDKLIHYAKAAGREVVEKALWLYYASRSPETPIWAKTAIYGALGYFISMIDAIPDLTPIVGYTDDLGVLVAAIATVSAYITPEVKSRANEKLRQWFGEPDESPANQKPR
jgi:uncharacterized membrane protein YkvA (DUF1232 family)